MYMKPGKDKDEWGGSEWEEKTPEESKREDGLEELVENVSGCDHTKDAGHRMPVTLSLVGELMLVL